MRHCQRLVGLCLGSLLLASCASVSPRGGEGGASPSAAPREVQRQAAIDRSAESVSVTAEDCDAMFIPVTDQDQDRDEDDCASPGSDELPGYDQGHTCKLDVAFVHPAQPAVGMTAVNCKRDKLVVKTEEELDKYLSKGKRVVPAVIGPDGNYYITDHHHLATGVYKTLQDKPDERQGIRLYAQIVGNFYQDPAGSPSQSQMLFFWEEQMQACNNAYLKYLGRPVDPLDPEEMPSALSGMKDDPYRTLSRWVRDADGYIKPDVQPANFLEFTWADKFRRDLDQPMTHCAIGDSVESPPCQEQIGQLRQNLDGAMASARAYDAVEWIAGGRCAGDLEGDPSALAACGYNPTFLDVEADKYITVDRGCEDPGKFSWQQTVGGSSPADTLAWYLYAHGHVTEVYRICRVAADGVFYAGIFDPDFEPETGGCLYVNADDKKRDSTEFDALTGVQGMYLWSEYTEKIAGDADKRDQFFAEAVPVGTEDTDLGETYVCAAGDKIGWVKKGKKTCHLSKKGRSLPFWVLVED